MTACAHLDTIHADHLDAPPATACEDCLRTGSQWVHLRRCLSCGHVGCCDSSPQRHARAHAGDSAHPLIQSAEPGEAWGWCYRDNDYVHLPRA